MKCPVDNNLLQITERNGIEVDYCPACRGVWLDRGELDKIIERANVMYTPVKEYSPEREQRENYYKGKKKKSFFEDIFDF